MMNDTKPRAGTVATNERRYLESDMDEPCSKTGATWHLTSWPLKSKTYKKRKINPVCIAIK